MRILLLLLLFIYSFASGQSVMTLPTYGSPPVPITPPTQTYTYHTNNSFVGTSTGSESQPWKTIQDAAAIMTTGQSLFVHAGSGPYRETVTPANSGTAGNEIIYEFEEGAVISGAEVASGGWTVHSGNIYKKTITLPVNGYNNATTNNTTILANQLFKDGVMMFEARWPNLNSLEDLLDRDKVRRIPSTPNSTTIVDASAPAGMSGARMWLNGWYVTIATTVSSHTGSTLTYTPSQSDAKKRKYYFLTGKLSLLDAEKEFHYESGTLYFWQPGGGSPTGVEYKERNYGFDLTAKDHIKIIGADFFACTPAHGSTSTDNVVIDGIHSEYMNHVILSPLQPGGIIMNTTYFNAEQTGIKLIGSNNIIKNSVLEYGASQAVWLGENGRMENNLVHHFGYDGNFGCGFMPWGPNIGSGGTGGQKVLNNTIYKMGRSCIDAGHSEHGQHLNMEVAYNDFYDYCRLNTDGGAFYVGHFTNTTGLRTHHNWFHDNGSAIDDGITAGLYYDQGSGPSLNDHNVFWNNIPTGPILAVGGAADYFATPLYEIRNAGPSRIENNTFGSTSNIGDSHSYKTSTFIKDQQRNNIYREDAICCGFSTTEPDITFSLKMNVNPLFTGVGAGGLAFRLSSGSPGINTGTTISGITDGAIGTPDMGAYEFGAPIPWVPGYSLVVSPPPDELAPPYLIEAESFNAKAGCFSDGAMIFGTDAGDWLQYNQTFADPKDVVRINYSRATAAAGSVEIRLGSIAGTLMGTVSLPSTGSWTSFTTTAPQAITGISGTQQIFIVFPSGANVANLNWYEFNTD